MSGLSQKRKFSPGAHVVRFTPAIQPVSATLCLVCRLGLRAMSPCRTLVPLSRIADHCLSDARLGKQLRTIVRARLSSMTSASGVCAVAVSRIARRSRRSSLADAGLVEP